MSNPKDLSGKFAIVGVAESDELYLDPAQRVHIWN